MSGVSKCHVPKKTEMIERQKGNRMAKKIAKQKCAQTAASAQQDIIGLITTLIEKLIALETKIDNVLSRVSRRTTEAPRQHAALPPTAPVAQNNNRRPMHKAVCADCGKDCEVPFRPSANRPVYCKVCYAGRRKQGVFMPRPPEPPKVAPVVKAPPPPAAKKKKSARKPGKKK